MTDDQEAGPEAAGLPIDPDRPAPVLGTARVRRTIEGLTLLAIAGGGALGAPARVALAQVLPTDPFSWATLVTNVSGSLLLGFLIIMLLERLPPSRYLRPFLVTGLCGAYTTFSTFAVEIDLGLRQGRIALPLLYGVASVVAGLLAVLLGMQLARLLPRRTAWRRARPVEPS